MTDQASHPTEPQSLIGRLERVLTSGIKSSYWSTALILIIAGGLGLLAYASLGDDSPAAQRLMSQYMLVGAAFLVGALLGFIFGIPRALQADGARASGDGGKQDQAATRYGENTNLEQVSDWLTKILIGITLTQFTEIKDMVGGFARECAPLFGGPDKTATAASAMILFGVAGFLFVYLWTRLFMASELQKAQASTARELEQLSRKQIDEQNETDASALRVVDQYLSSGSVPAGIDEATLRDLVKRASPQMRAHIFARARELRRKGYDDREPAMAERSIRVFEALVEAEPSNHQVRGQLGYAYKEKPGPDWRKAEETLGEAIRLRGSPDQAGFHNYEFVRAICRVMQELEKPGAPPSEPAIRDSILADLRIATEGRIKITSREERIWQWFSINGIDPDTLKPKGG